MTYAPRPQKRKALIIGINYDDEDLSTSQASRGLGQLLASRKDAIDFRNLLVGEYTGSRRLGSPIIGVSIDVYDYRPQDVTLMTDSKDRAHHLIPTRKNMVCACVVDLCYLNEHARRLDCANQIACPWCSTRRHLCFLL